MLMSEEEIERSVESKMNALDRKFMNTAMTQAEYDAEVRKINEWAENEYRTLRKSD